MKLHPKAIKVALIIAVLIALAALGLHYKLAEEAKVRVAPAPIQHEPGMVRFGANSPQLSTLKIAEVAEVPLPVADPINGRVSYNENVTSRVTSPVLGRVTALHAEIGDSVKRGQSLVEIDSPDLASAEADAGKAVADETRKRLAFERAKTLYEGEVLARKDYESAEADLLQAKAETQRANQRLRNLNATGRKDGSFSLDAPIAGVIADKQINPGQEVRPDLPNPLYVVTDIHHLWVIVDVPERSAIGLHDGQVVSLESDSYPGRLFTAKVERVALALDPNTRRIQVRCAVDNPDMALKPEMFVRVAFLADEGGKRGIKVPNTSLFIEGLYSYVFVERQPGTFEKRRVNVKVKGYSDSYIDSGLSKGERVVTEGAFLLNAEVSADAQ